VIVVSLNHNVFEDDSFLDTLVEIDRRFRDGYYLQNDGEMPVCLYQTKRRHIPGDFRLYTRRLENQ
jgi:hypothetical protein